MKDWRDRFEEKVDRRAGPAGCHLWLASVNRKGYGRFKVGGKLCLAHRLAFALATGRNPVGQVCHTCDVPSCVNPAHLWEGTNAQNQADKACKDRTWKPRGSANPYSKLTWSAVAEIRRRVELGETQSAVAADFNIVKQTVQKIVSGERWRRA